MSRAGAGAGAGTSAAGAGSGGGGDGSGVNVAREGEWTVARPPTPFVDEDGVSKGWYELEHNGWFFRSQERPIANAEERREISQELKLERGLHIPEMTYSNNYLELVMAKAGIRILIDPVHLLHNWNELQHETSLSEDGTLNATNYDWTYTHEYKGSIDIDREVFRGLLRQAKVIEDPYFGKPNASTMRIPEDRLLEKGHIHYYASIDLLEDELRDRGNMSVQVKIRVMKDLFLVLIRSFLRLDGKRVRLVDTRYYHSFDEAMMLRDTMVREATMEDLRKASEGARPFSATVSDKAQRDERFFAQPDQVYELIEPKSVEREMIPLSVT